ncbi:sporulation histidine kinase inhibitor Sda [Bacillus thermotolerans]|uniref:sporulation histidine kinase inhibitor Sda n=1 Tax=Bacillus thermotolerans TaxID=1221996 RepID=UPI0005826A14|nr:sporulation histidine kinase inhibitor Sda [Bacillus thermotolerans]KKB34408.1 hypothetical protein QY97_02481 [Bacillus thermotolerans]
MHQLSDEELLIVYREAIKLNKTDKLQQGFIDLLKEELNKRNLSIKAKNIED